MGAFFRYMAQYAANKVLRRQHESWFIMLFLMGVGDGDLFTIVAGNTPFGDRSPANIATHVFKNAVGVDGRDKVSQKWSFRNEPPV